MVVLTVGANSYGTLAEADAYLDESIRAASIWIGKAPDDKRRSLVSAFRLIEKQRLKGEAVGVSIVSAVAVNAGGSGYVLNEVLTVTGGTFGEAAQVKVTSVSAGAVTGVELIHAGTYTTEPAGTGEATTSSGSGTGCTLDLTFTSQTSLLPRSGLVDCDGASLESDEYPEDFKHAQFELAFELSVDSDLETATGTGTNIKAAGAGSAKVEFFRPVSDVQRFPTVVSELLECYLESGISKLAFASGTEEEGTFGDVENVSYGLTEGL